MQGNDRFVYHLILVDATADQPGGPTNDLLSITDSAGSAQRSKLKRL